MKKIFIISCLLLGLQSYSQQYFQQEVDYRIQVTLNDKNNTLSAYEEFDYTNNSNCALDFIYIHLWPNAYKNTKTALAKQLFRTNDMSLQFASEEERGYIDSLDFKVDGQTAKWEFDAEHIDIAKLYLPKPLNPGEKITVSTPFKVKIPTGKISRLGFVGESFQITQWYPKPAVFDVNGWHQMPYLTQGEFYSEYGSFDVSITIPKNYVVGATGDLQTESEIAFLEEKVAETQKKFDTDTFKNSKKIGGGSTAFPESSGEMKTIRFTQNNVHDFAWFADKRFEVLKGEVKLPHTNRLVTTWAMFVPHHANLWKDAIEYLNDGTYYYSKWNGDYPYNHVTAVDGTISAGGGMEYPNITVIGNASSKIELEVVIVHEVGHNWFYGLLGSNERDHPWMDEGLNTLNEIRYIKTKYPNNTQLSDMMGGMAEMIHLDHLSHHDMSDLTYRSVASLGLDQPIELHSDDYTSVNYGGIVYSKTGLMFTYLKDYLGEEVFDNCMQTYFDRWHFKHPQPYDLRQVFEEVSGKNLSWFFDDIIHTTKHIDHKICKVKVTENGTDVTVKNVGHIDCPVRVDVYSLGQYRGTQWVEPGNKKTTVHFEEKTFDKIILDSQKQMPEVNRNNNFWRSKGVFGKMEPIQIDFLAGDNDFGKTNIWYTPIMGFNVYDKFMLGVLFHNQTLPKNKFEYTLAPMFSFGRMGVSGFADVKYSMVPPKYFKTVSVGIKARTFENRNLIFNSEYYVVNPYMLMHLGKPAKRSKFRQTLLLQGVFVNEKFSAFSVNTQNTIGGFGDYKMNFKHRIHQIETRLRVDYVNLYDLNYDLANLSAEAKYKITYWLKKKKNIELRAFVGQNLFTNGVYFNRYAFSLGGQSGSQDFFFENYMIGRNETDNFLSQQRNNNQGGFGTVSNIGSNVFIFTSNIFIEIPYLPLGIYGDLGFADINNNLEMFINSGIGFRLMDGNIGVYFPLYESQNLIDSYVPDIKYAQKIRFTLNMNAFNVEDMIRKAF